MRILFVGAYTNYAIEKPYLNYLSQSKNVSYIDLFAAQNLFLRYYNKSLINKILYRAGLSNILKDINLLLKKKILDSKPDVVLIFKGMEIFPETIKIIKGLGIKVINYNPDNPFIFSGKGSGNRNVTDSIGLYNLHLTYNMEVKNRIENEYKIPVKILPFGFDINDDLYMKCVNQQEIVKVCFLGNPDKDRAIFIKELAKLGIWIDVYGNNWVKWISHPNVAIHSPVYEDELWKTLRRYRIQLNLMRIHNLNSHNMRSFEVPGVGGIMVAPKTIDHELYFENKKEIFLYTTLEDCAETIRGILRFSSTEADKIRNNARRRSINCGYTYKDRAKQLLTELQKFEVLKSG